MALGMLNCMCQLDWVRDALVGGKQLCLGVYLRRFSEEINIKIGELSKAAHARWDNPLRG